MIQTYKSHRYFDTACMALGLALTILAIHFPALSVFYVQDDAYAWLISEKWSENYFNLGEVLQYRPNSALFTHLLDLIAPDEPWPLRLAGMAILWMIGMLMYRLMKRLSDDRPLAVCTAFLTVAHPGFYSIATLYLSAAMTGLGLIFVLCGMIYAHEFALRHSRLSYFLTFLSLVAALTSYEAAIITLPLMLGIDYLYNTRRCLRRTFIRYLPHILITLAYLCMRSQGIAANTADGQIAGYAPTLSVLKNNFLYLSQNLFGLPYAGLNDTHIVIAALTGLTSLSCATLYLYKRKEWRFALAVIALIGLGMAPFLFTANIALHYVFYAIPGFALLLGLACAFLIRTFGKIAWLAPVMLVALGFAINHIAYKHHVLTVMAYTGENIVSEFRNLHPERQEKRDILFMNVSNRIAWTIHFGNSINIFYRNDPFRFNFPQGEWPLFDFKEPMAIYLDHMAGDTEDLHNRVVDVSELYHPALPWRDIVPVIETDKGSGAVEIAKYKERWRIKVQQDIAYLKLAWRPPASLSEPYTLTFDVDVPQAYRLESVWHNSQGKSVTCHVMGAPLTLSLPPKKWIKNDTIALARYGLKKGETIVIRSARVKNSFEMTNAAYTQTCSESMFHD